VRKGEAAVTCGLPVIIRHPRTSAGECTLQQQAHPRSLSSTPASGYSSPVESRVYATIVSVVGVPTVPTQRSSVRATRFRPSGCVRRRDTAKGAECVTW
jgi:hypothetical protein